MKFWKSVFYALLLVTLLIWISVFSFPDKNLHVIACDVGQGDAILITYKNHQVLIDGGPDNKVLDCLSKNITFWDRTLEVVILTNPDLDHHGGLVEVFKRYKVENFVKSPTPDSTQSYSVLEDIVGSSGTNTIIPTSGQSIRYGLIYLDILYPSVSLDYGFKNPQNNHSIVTKLSFGNFEAIFTGDIEDQASDFIAQNIAIGDVDYIKVPHHGSKNGLTKSLIEKTRPEVAVISAGKNNRYGHPHKEVMDLLNSFQIKTLRTDEMGDVKIVSDGKDFWMVE